MHSFACNWRSPSIWFIPGLALALFALGGQALGETSLPVARPDAPAGADSGVRSSSLYSVEELRDLPYHLGRDADRVRHRLDLYLPQGKRSFPVVVFVHGGAWLMGDKSFYGHGSELGHHYASHGIGVVMPNYRLSPAVKHPGHVEDLARVVAWIVRNISKYGGNSKRVYLCGHSAGGHLVSLLASDPLYLKAQGLAPSVIKGVIAISGVYREPKLSLTLGSRGKKSMLRNVNWWFSPFAAVFGDNPQTVQRAFPLHHIRKRAKPSRKLALPPFLLLHAERDIPMLGEMAEEFAQALKKAGAKVQHQQILGRDHESVLFQASTGTDPVSRVIRGFVSGSRSEDSSR